MPLKRFLATLKSQRGWTTVEYVVGAIILIGIVTTVLVAFQGGLEAKMQTLVDTLTGSAPAP